jgi:TPR repeat protein
LAVPIPAPETVEVTEVLMTGVAEGAVVVAVIERVARCGLLLAGLAACQSVWAVDPDILINAQARQTEVAPLCGALMAREADLDPQAQYQKALCLLYGVQMPQQAAVALDLLRVLSAQGQLEAQLALADTLQQGDTAQQKEAQKWYGQASSAGDVRATLRLTRLTQRLNAAAVSANPAPASNDADPNTGDGSGSWQQPGYHCHMYGFGKKICHGGMD